MNVVFRRPSRPRALSLVLGGEPVTFAKKKGTRWWSCFVSGSAAVTCLQLCKITAHWSRN